MTKSKLIPVLELRSRLTYPGGSSSSKNTAYLYMDKLGIRTVLVKMEGKRTPIAHVTETDAKRIVEDFRAVHWRRFREGSKK